MTVATPAPAALMVGDRASHDGGAPGIGIATLILPRPGDPASARLGMVVDLLG